MVAGRLVASHHPSAVPIISCFPLVLNRTHVNVASLARCCLRHGGCHYISEYLSTVNKRKAAGAEIGVTPLLSNRLGLGRLAASLAATRRWRGISTTWWSLRRQMVLSVTANGGGSTTNAWQQVQCNAYAWISNGRSITMGEALMQHFNWQAFQSDYFRYTVMEYIDGSTCDDSNSLLVTGNGNLVTAPPNLHSPH